MKRDRLSIHRVVARAIVFTVLGAIVSAGMSLGLPMMSNDLRTHIVAMNMRAIADGIRYAHIRVEMQVDDEWTEVRAVDPRGGSEIHRTRGAWYLIEMEQSSEGTTSSLKTGWPTLSMAGPLRIPSIANLRGQPIEMQHKPIWPGFAINTIFYAIILWLLWTAPFAMRRRRRIKRNLCPACAYPIGTSPLCTECGDELPAAKIGRPT